MNIEDRGFILKKIEFGDFDFIATIFTERLGKTSFIIKNARKSKKRFSGKLEPFNLVIVNFKSNSSDNSTKILNSIQLDDNYDNQIMDKNTIILSSLVNEYIDNFEINEVPNSKTFDLIKNFFLKVSKESLIKVLDKILEFQISYLTLQWLKPTLKELERIEGKKVLVEKSKIKKNASSRIKLIKSIAKFSQFHSGKELNSIKYLDLL